MSNSTDASRSVRASSVIAGVGLAAMAVLAPLAVFGVLGVLVTEGDAARTASDILASEGTFRAGIASLVAVVLLDVIVASALFGVFAPVNRTLSTLAAWFRLAYSAVFLVAISELVGAVNLLGDADSAAPEVQVEALSRIGAFTDIWDTGLILFACHLLLIGYLAFRSGYIARVFGVLLVIAGLGYLVDGFGAVLLADYSISVGMVAFVGEVALIFWLLIRGRRVTVTREPVLV